MASKSVVRIVGEASPRPERSTPAARVAPIGFHLVLRLTDDRVIARTPAERRLLARVVYEIGDRYGLLAFGAADTHLHIVIVGSRRAAGLFARYVATSLRWQLELAAQFEPCRIRPINDQRHLENAVRYVFNQEQHHGIDADPLFEASSLPELLGMRALSDGATRRLAEHLPRLGITAPALLDAALHGASDETHLLESALGAMALPQLGRDPASQRARHAAVHASRARTGVLAKRLRVDATSVRRWRKLAPEPLLVQAIQRQLRARGALAARLARARD